MGSLKARLEISFLFFITPSLVIYYFLACDKFQCSLAKPVLELWTGELTIPRLVALVPHPTYEAVKIAFLWIGFQAFLYLYCPGPKAYGQETPAGHVLEYNANGLNAWFVTHFVLAGLVYYGVIPASILYDNWGPLLIVANIIGFALAIFAYIKANYFPTHPDDCKFGKSGLYDFFMGIEFNPRIGKVFDFKLFFNGRPGIIGWNVINLSFMAAQYKMHGFVSNSMILVTLLHLIYILDFFFNEDWYLKTIDICHDHYGWYLAWGDVVWLPWMYTLQGYYLVTNPITLSTPYFLLVLTGALTGYYIFRASNEQRHRFRKLNGKMTIWGKPAEYITAYYTTGDGRKHQSLLLTSGFWGLSRHFNYLGDLLFSFSCCAACGTNHFLPYFYIVNMLVLLLWRIERDHSRCGQKYGPFWVQYCQKVPYKLVPYIY